VSLSVNRYSNTILHPQLECRRRSDKKEGKEKILKFIYLLCEEGGSTVVKVLRYIRKVAGSIPAGISGFFIDIKALRSHYGPGFDSASNRNEYQEYSLGVKAAGALD